MRVSSTAVTHADLAALPRVAVVGSGIAGLAAAWRLRGIARVTLFEAGSHFGGHAHTVDVELEGRSVPVDTGFLVLNPRTYPGLLGLFAELGVQLAPAQMSFSVQGRWPGGTRLEWAGSDLDSLFAQRANALRPGFWRMLRDILRFNREATALALDARADGTGDAGPSVGAFLRDGGYSEEFRDGYFLPMAACIWSCPTETMLAFPMRSMARFCHNHALLQWSGRPQWLTVRGGSRRYVQRVLEGVADKRLRTPVRALRRHGDGVEVVLDGGSEHFEHVVLACHSDQALALLEQPTREEREVLSSIGYQRNRAVLHLDESLLPRSRRAWAAWNYESAPDGQGGGEVCVHYLINRLQPLPVRRSVLVSLNPLREPAPASVLREIDYAHPVFDAAAIAAQARVPGLQGVHNTWYCGAWCGYGFHEDGLRAGYAAADALLHHLALRQPLPRAA
ncbi:MAG: FAD-dependent oxidoreductase [Betaproteobacteria bacterium]|nr:FAD-dependent oxidoreductase [Betaproteobacteria bacterium]